MITEQVTVIRLLVAFVLGGVIGLERQKKGVGAGLRTHILVCVGSTLFTLVSIYFFELYAGKCQIDPSRIAAGIVTGIGFLGAGTIIRGDKGVHGLTTAASIWVSSAIGMAVGIGYFSAALVMTALSVITLYVLKLIERKLEK